MAWTDSRIFREWVRSCMGHGQTAGVLPAGYGGLVLDGVKAALFNDDVVPDRNAARTSTGYNTGTWLTADEVTGASEWVAGGRALASKTLTTPSSGVIMFDADNIVGSATVTMSGIHGCLVYDDDTTAGTGGIADQGISFNYFGGTTGVTAGTYSILWNSNGVYRITV